MLGVDVVLGVTHSGVNGVVLVNPNVVGEDPDAGESSGDDSELACNEELSSGGLGVLGEEHNEEAGSNNEWNVEEEQNGWEVPVDVVVQDQEVVHGDEIDREEHGEDTDGDNSALNWEACAAGGADGVLVGAHAKAAAAWGHNVLLWNGLLSALRSGVFLFFHEWLRFFSHHHVHSGGLFFHIINCFCNIIIFSSRKPS